MRVRTKRMVWLVLGITAVAVVAYVSAVVGIDTYQFRKNKKLAASFKLGQPHRKTLVVYFSRSGNTELMAYKIAEVTQGTVISLVATDYPIGFKGWVNALVDARKTAATISPQIVDLSRYVILFMLALQFGFTALRLRFLSS